VMTCRRNERCGVLRLECGQRTREILTGCVNSFHRCVLAHIIHAGSWTSRWNEESMVSNDKLITLYILRVMVS